MYRRALLLSPFLLAGTVFSAEEDRHYDVIIIGSGAAGLSAACSALQHGAKRVLILEKGTVLGGHSILSTGYVSAVDRARQKPMGISDSPQLMLSNMIDVGGGKNDISLARIVCDRSEEAIGWLEDMGIKWENQISQTAAGIFPRSHISSNVRAGYDYVLALNKYARAGGAKVLLRTKALRLIEENGRVIGVEAQREGDRAPIRFYAKGTVIATGGFTANVPMRKGFDPRLTEEFSTTANPSGRSFDGATGDGLLMARELGAALVHAEYLQLIPFWGGRLVDYVGADIFVNKHGERFVDEGASWKDISDAIWRQPDREMWAITDSQSRKGASLGLKLLNKIVEKADTVSEMSLRMHVPVQNLAKTLQDYNDFAETGLDPKFNKIMFTQQINKPPYYFGREKLYVHFCCGGIRFNEEAAVVREDGSVIKGLFVAGEAGGGPHGHDRMGGVSLTTAFVFGRIAGLSAVRA